MLRKLPVVMEENTGNLNPLNLKKVSIAREQ
jgi:hypothetical protein